MEKENYFKDKAVGIAVVHLMASYYEDNIIHFHPTMDYHLHNLLYCDKELGHIGVLCLDTNDLQITPYAKGQDIRQMFSTLTMYTAQFFVDKIDSMINAAAFSKELLFDRVEQELWDKFNEIKEDTFIDKLPHLIKYLDANKSVLHREELDIKREPDLYRWAEISLTEERFIESVIA